MSSKHDPANYRKMSEPHETYAAGEAALKAFLADVEEARKRHRVADVHAIVQTPVMLDNGTEGMLGYGYHFGSSSNALPMTARAYYHERLRIRDYLAALMRVTDTMDDPDDVLAPLGDT